MTMQELTEAPSSPERRWLALPKVMSKLLSGGAF